MGIFRIKLFDAFRAYAVTKISLGVLTNVSFKLVPIAFIIAYLLARSAHGQQTAQLLHFGKGLLKFGD